MTDAWSQYETAWRECMKMCGGHVVSVHHHDGDVVLKVEKPGLDGAKLTARIAPMMAATLGQRMMSGAREAQAFRDRQSAPTAPAPVAPLTNFEECVAAAIARLKAQGRL